VDWLMPGRRRGFRFAGHAVRVEGDADPLRWLEEFVEPQFAASDAEVPDETIRFIVDADLYARLLACGPDPQNLSRACVTLDSGVISGRVWQAPDAAEVVFDERRDVFYRRPPQESRVVQVIVARDSADARVALMRVLREYAMLHASHAGWLPVHAAAVSIGDDAIVIAGPKKAGKTSLLLHALCNEGGTYVSNDRVALQIRPGAVTVHGIPTVVSIRSESVSWFHTLASKLADVRLDAGPPTSPARTDGPARPADNVELTPAQLCRVVDVRSRAAAGVTALVYPEVGPVRGGASLEALQAEPALDALRGVVFRACPADGMFGSAAAVPAASTDELAAQVVARLPSFRCRLGPDAYRDRWLSSLGQRVRQSSRPRMR
jgi:hypothetical protein